MYKNHTEYLQESSDCRENMKEKLGNITAERDSFEKVQHYQDLNNYLQPKIK